MSAPLLHLLVSERGESSHSRRAAGEALRDFSGPRIVRDLTDPLLPHPDSRFTRASLMPQAQRGPAEQVALTLSETLIGELESAERVFIASPMHNFTVPSLLKSWIDHVVRPRRTFVSTPSGKQGLVPDRPVLALVACGGPFGDSPAAQTDFFTPYLRYALGSIGLRDVQVVLMPSLNREAGIDEGVARARAWLSS